MWSCLLECYALTVYDPGLANCLFTCDEFLVDPGASLDCRPDKLLAGREPFLYLGKERCCCSILSTNLSCLSVGD